MHEIGQTAVTTGIAALLVAGVLAGSREADRPILESVPPRGLATVGALVLLLGLLLTLG